MQYFNDKIKKTHIYIFLLYIFFILYIFLIYQVGYHHEPWADEAQSWLISRDKSFWGIFQETKYEGHPFVWFYIERTFIKIFSVFTDVTKLYNWIFILPLIATSIGVYLLLFKSKFPLWIKLSVPFTFYIFYQYGVIARNHCLCFPMLAIIATFYQSRFKHPFIYMFLLILNANTSAYLYPVSLVLIIFFFIDYHRNKDNNKNLSYGISVFIGILFLCLTGIHMYNPTDCYFWGGVSYAIRDLKIQLGKIANIYFLIKQSFVYMVISLIMTVFLYIVLIKVYCRNIYQLSLFLSLNIPLYILYVYLYMQPWHYGYAFVILLFTCWLLTDINKIENIPFKKNLLFYILMFYIIGYYIYANISVCSYDLKYNYSGSKDAAIFIKKYNLQNYKMTGFGMKSVALQPYFSKNIYNNYIGATHFSWRDAFFKKYTQKRLEQTPIIISEDFDYYIFSDTEYKNFIDNIKDSYYEYFFEGELIGRHASIGESENNSYRIYIDKNLANNLNIEKSNN